MICLSTLFLCATENAMICSLKVLSSSLCHYKAMVCLFLLVPFKDCDLFFIYSTC